MTSQAKNRLPLLQTVVELLCPMKCMFCGAFPGPEDSPATGFCTACLCGMAVLPEAHCRHCGRPFETRIESRHTCSRCLKNPPPYARALAAGLHQDTLRKAIHYFKYNGRTELARPLAVFMTQHLERPFYPPETDLILPIPLHRRRLQERGFNQALLLARALFKPWKKKIHHDLLQRIRWTEPQVNLKGQERLKNVRQAFAAPSPDKIKGRSVMLIDDVYTTGATVIECTRALKKAGAAQVLVLTLARVGLN
ncbi:MAG: ComF family protein [Pseudomonadota bacterium]